MYSGRGRNIDIKTVLIGFPKSPKEFQREVVKLTFNFEPHLDVKSRKVRINQRVHRDRGRDSTKPPSLASGKRESLRRQRKGLRGKRKVGPVRRPKK